MSLPNYLASIKSSGFYRFVWDKSQMPAPQAQVLRLLVGYSEKGPFNTLVYIDNPADFITTFGNISKRLEKRGIFFHRLALQALSAGPVLVLNLKPFNTEQTNYTRFCPGIMYEKPTIQQIGIRKVFDTNRFWYIDPEHLNTRINTFNVGNPKDYITMIATDTKDTSCSYFIRKTVPSNYNLTFRQWYAGETSDEAPAYMEPLLDKNVSDYFAEVYVFKGKFEEALITKGGVLAGYFEDNGSLKKSVKNAYGEDTDTLEALSQDPSSRFLGKYTGILLPGFKNAVGTYISLDVVFNRDNYRHKMLMKMDERVLENVEQIGDVFEDVARYYDVTKSYELKKIDEEGAKKLVPETEKKLDKLKGAAFDNLDKAKNNDGTTKITGETKVIAVKNNSAHEYYSVTFKEVINRVHPESGEVSKYSALSAVDNATSLNDIFRKKSADATFSLKVKIDPIGDTKKLVPVYLEGYDYKTITRKDTGKDLQKKIFDVLTNEKGIRLALTNRVDAEYRYIVDTFQSYITGGCKAALASIAKEKDNAFAILNMPPMEAFIQDAEGRFMESYRNTITGHDENRFSMALLADKTKGFSLASEVEGASWCGYFTQVAFSDGVFKNYVPSAALVSNNFLAKYSGRQPYYIVAGPNYGVLNYAGMVGPDYNYSRADLDILEPLGVNAIVYVPRKGTYINSNQTAKQTPISALSKIHIRELVIYLQDEIEYMLQSYQWELNTQALRDKIKAKADYILNNVKENGGVYVFNTVCDETNNTPEVIDNEIVLLDVEIEPARGAGKMVQTLTLHRTGGMSGKA